MEQVPKVGIVGSGKLARHLSFYFRQLNLQTILWERPRQKPEGAILDCPIIFLAVSDEAIELVGREYRSKNTILLHCSGSLIFDDIIGVHPLMTFASSLYSLSVYKSIPLIMEHYESEDLKQLFTLLEFLPNPKKMINKENKPLYHALCVLGGNLSTMLWSEVFDRCAEIGLEPELFHPYLNKITENLKQGGDILTGPIVRKDRTTIKKNLQALEGNPYKQVYESFLRL